MHLVDAESEPKESANGLAVAYAARVALNAATGPGVNGPEGNQFRVLD